MPSMERALPKPKVSNFVEDSKEEEEGHIMILTGFHNSWVSRCRFRPVALEGISGAMSSGCLDTPRHLQGVWDQLLRKESLGQCRPDVCTLPDTSRECGTSCSGRNLWGNVVRTSA